MERFAKTQLLHKDKDGLSAMPCGPYQERFMEKMKVLLGLDENRSFSRGSEGSGVLGDL